MTGNQAIEKPAATIKDIETILTVLQKYHAVAEIVGVRHQTAAALGALVRLDAMMRKSAGTTKPEP